VCEKGFPYTELELVQQVNDEEGVNVEIWAQTGHKGILHDQKCQIEEAICKKKRFTMVGTEEVVFKRLSTALLLTPRPWL
jgi:hypothetical protein